MAESVAPPRTREVAMGLYGCWLLRRALILLAGGMYDLGLIYARHSRFYFDPSS